ncbi:phosphotransferase [Paenibacillus lemnae]|uniref:Phosphotransferase n=1 Tax=Paenibacillus lemnae TaxID=1330551 RepID=A0A848MB16_PAELE|nr:phosphotransferase [Paenibacillus lemnae]NMO97865.1 phosphotransferase [Paenibacillus lemnae]
MEQLHSIISKHWPGRDGEITEGRSGWNNTTRYLHNENFSSVIRIYNTHQDMEKIQFEHHVLEQLQQRSLPFMTPKIVPTVNGETAVRLPDEMGRCLCVFDYIPGAGPETDSFGAAYSLGKTAAGLSKELGELDLKRKPVYPPYFELTASYPECTPQAVRDFCERPPAAFQDVQGSLLSLYAAYAEVAKRLKPLSSLPKQLVHGDLNPSNILVDSQHPDIVTAVLDFEFCTLDIRVMEPAVTISDLLGYEGKQELIERYCRGFGEVLKLREDEVNALPILLQLRKVDVFLHFLRRYLNGTDQPEVLKSQTVALHAELAELQMDQDWLSDAVTLLYK